MTKLIVGAAAMAALSAAHPVSRGLQSVRADTPAPTLAEVMALVNNLNAAHTQFREANDRRLAEIEARGSADTVSTEKVDRINAEITSIQSALDEANRVIASLRVGGVGGGQDRLNSPEARAHAEAFIGFMAGRMGPQGEQVQARGGTFSSPDGGFLASPTIEDGISRILAAQLAMRRLAQVISIGTGSYIKHKSVGGAGARWSDETETGDERGETGTPKLVRMEFEPHELTAEPGASQTFLEDASADVEGWYNNETAIGFGEQEGAAFVSGNGVKKPKGFLAYGAVDNANYKWGKVGFVKSGGAADFAAADPVNAFIDLIHALKPGYRNGAAFLMNDLTAAKIRKLTDNEGRYLWQPAVQLGQPSTFLGYGVDTDDNMPAVEANALAVAFANWKQFYLIVDRLGVVVLRNPYKVNGVVLFYTRKRVGGGIQNFEAGKLLKIAA